MMKPTLTASRSARRTAPALLILAAALAGLGGCYTPGGVGYSLDQYTYESTSFQPWTVTVVDTRTGQAFWSQDVPVGKQLVINFVEGRGVKDSEFTPDLMQWQVMPIGRRFGGLENQIPVPPSTARRIDTKLRPVPELPEEMLREGPTGAAASPSAPSTPSSTAPPVTVMQEGRPESGPDGAPMARPADGGMPK